MLQIQNSKHFLDLISPSSKFKCKTNQTPDTKMPNSPPKNKFKCETVTDVTHTDKPTHPHLNAAQNCMQQMQNSHQSPPKRKPKCETNRPYKNLLELAQSPGRSPIAAIGSSDSLTPVPAFHCPFLSPILNASSSFWVSGISFSFFKFSNWVLISS